MFAAYLQIRFMCCSKFSLLSVSTPVRFTWDATLMCLEPILKISFVWFCFLLAIIMAWNFPGFTIILFSLKQFKATLHSDAKDPINSWIVLLKQARVLSSAKLRQLLIKWNKWSHWKTSYIKWVVVLIHGEHLKWHLQGNFEYHLF